MTFAFPLYFLNSLDHDDDGGGGDCEDCPDGEEAVVVGAVAVEALPVEILE